MAYPLQQPEYHSTLNGRILLRREARKSLGIHKSDVPKDGQYRAELNHKKQIKEISDLKFEELQQSKDGCFQAKVTIKMPTGEELPFTSSCGKATKREACEDAARVACVNLGGQAHCQVSKSVRLMKKQSSGQLSPVKQQPSNKSNPMEDLKEGAPDKGQYRAELKCKKQAKEISDLEFKALPQLENGSFQAKVTFNTATGELLSFTGLCGKATKREAYEEAARVACQDLGGQAQVPKLTGLVKKQASGQSSPVKQQASFKSNPMKELKEVAPDKGQYRAELNRKKQTKEISDLNFENLPQSEDGCFRAKVTFKTATGELSSFTSSCGKATKSEAHEEAARVACLQGK